MQRRWSQFRFSRSSDGTLVWAGTVRGFQRQYEIGILWHPSRRIPPYVLLLNPKLRPRDGEQFEDIPHLWFDRDDPESSGLCLFDPNGREWSAGLFIADTTVPWAAEWLSYYELWLADGIWRGGGTEPATYRQRSAAC